MENIVIKVRTEKLINVASELTKSVDETQKAFQQMEDIVKASCSYWEGRGHDAMVSTYLNRSDDYERIFKAIKTHASNLLEIAGVYAIEERRNTAIATMLAGDVIQ